MKKNTLYIHQIFPEESSFYEDGYHVSITQVNVRVTGAHHLDIINLGEAPDKDVNDDHSGGVSVVCPRGSDPGVIHFGVHQRVQNPFFNLPAKDQKCVMCQEYQYTRDYYI